MPFGYRAKDGMLTADATEQAVVARMTALRADGISYNRIADALNADGILTKHGSSWHSQTMKNTLAVQTA